MGLAVALTGWSPRSTEIVVAAVALLAGALVALFTQLAAWRERLGKDGRALPIKIVDEAVALSLVSAVVAVLVAVLFAVLPNLPPSDARALADHIVDVVQRVLSGAAVALSLNLVLSFVVIVNLLWSAYEEANRTQRPSISD